MDNGAEIYLREVLAKISEFNESLSAYTQNEQRFSTEVVADLHLAKRVLDSCLTKLRKDFDKITGAEDPILHLLQMSRHVQLIWDTFQQQLFRSCVLTQEPNEQNQFSLLRAHQYPVYLSSLPPLVESTKRKLLEVQIFMPPDDDKKSDQSMDQQSITQHLQSWLGVEAIFDELLNRLGLGSRGFDIFNTAFRVVGLNEYIHGPQPLNCFLSAREAIAKEKPLRLQIIKMNDNLDQHFYDRITKFLNDLRQDFYKRGNIAYTPHIPISLSQQGGTSTPNNTSSGLGTPTIMETTEHSPYLADIKARQALPMNAGLRETAIAEEEDLFEPSRRSSLSTQRSPQIGGGGGRGRGGGPGGTPQWDIWDENEVQRQVRERSQSRARGFTGANLGMFFNRPAPVGNNNNNNSSGGSGGGNNIAAGTPSLPTLPDSTTLEEAAEESPDSDFGPPVARGGGRTSAFGIDNNDNQQTDKTGGNIYKRGMIGGADDDDDDDDDQPIVIRPLTACKPVDFGITARDELRDPTVVKRPTASGAADDDDDPCQKRKSGVLTIPQELLALRTTVKNQREYSDSDDDFAPPGGGSFFTTTPGGTNNGNARSGSAFTNSNNNTNPMRSMFGGLSKPSHSSGATAFTPNDTNTLTLSTSTPAATGAVSKGTLAAAALGLNPEENGIFPECPEDNFIDSSDDEDAESRRTGQSFNMSGRDSRSSRQSKNLLSLSTPTKTRQLKDNNNNNNVALPISPVAASSSDVVVNKQSTTTNNDVDDDADLYKLDDDDDDGFQITIRGGDEEEGQDVLKPLGAPNNGGLTVNTTNTSNSLPSPTTSTSTTTTFSKDTATTTVSPQSTSPTSQENNEQKVQDGSNNNNNVSTTAASPTTPTVVTTSGAENQIDAADTFPSAITYKDASGNTTNVGMVTPRAGSAGSGSGSNNPLSPRKTLTPSLAQANATPSRLGGTPGFAGNRRASIAPKNSLFKLSTLNSDNIEEMIANGQSLSLEPRFGQLFAPELIEKPLYSVTDSDVVQNALSCAAATASKDLNAEQREEYDKLMNQGLLDGLVALPGTLLPTAQPQTPSVAYPTGFRPNMQQQQQEWLEQQQKENPIAYGGGIAASKVYHGAVRIDLRNVNAISPSLLPLYAKTNNNSNNNKREVISTLISPDVLHEEKARKIIPLHEAEVKFPRMQPYELKNSMNTGVLDLANSMSYNNLPLPAFKVKIQGLDGITTRSCPRLGVLGLEKPGQNRLAVVTCIICPSNEIHRGSLGMTSYVQLSQSPRFHEAILPLEDNSVRPITYSELPKSAKIAFILVESVPGQKKFINKDVISKDSKDAAGGSGGMNSTRHIPLAWCTQQLFLPNDEILTGPRQFEMWPLPTSDDDSCAQMLGASCYLTDPYLTNNGKNPTISNKDKEKDNKKKEQDVGYIVPKLPGCDTVIDNLDVTLLNYIFRGSNNTNFMSGNVPPVSLYVDFNAFSFPVVNSTESLLLPPPMTILSGLREYPRLLDTRNPKELTKPQQALFDQLVAADALHDLTPEQKNVMWTCRETFCDDYPHLLPLFLQCVLWNSPHHRYDALRLLETWPEPESMIHCIALLDQPFTDYRVRLYAVRHLEQMSQFDVASLRLYLLQLTQCLKFEPHHISPLARLLLGKAVQFPYQFGHDFFWALKNEAVVDPPFSERYRVLLEAYLTFSPLATDQLRTQQHIIDECTRLAIHIRQSRDSGVPSVEIMENYQQGLKHLNRDYFSRLPTGVFQVPLDPRWESNGIVPAKCKIMSSKMAPLWLVFENSDITTNGKQNHMLIFKAGDDLRQDMLTLQVLKFFDKIWLEHGMDLKLSAYNVLATGQTEAGKGLGLVEIVQGSNTISGIQTDGRGASAAFDEKCIYTYLEGEHPEVPALEKAIDNFAKSMAGYCVATYVLGVGDRHNSNVMLKKDGCFLHIDFGHFLGNFKKKFGVQRERSLVLFTKEMKYVMEDKKHLPRKGVYEQFMKDCLEAISIVRKHAHELETLFILMISAGMPELTSKQSINYIRERLCLDKPEQACRDTFKQELKTAASSSWRNFDNFVHNLKHKQ